MKKRGEKNKSKIEILFQIGGNITFSREPDKEKYCKYLINTIKNFDYPITSLNFSGIFYIKSLHEYLYQLDLSNIKNSIIELDLSLCNLTDNEIDKLS